MEINIEGVTHYYGENKVLHDVHLAASHGELVALLGPSGCGKTTLLHLIAGLLPLSTGKIYFGGKDMSNVEARKRNAVMVFQNYALFPHERSAECGVRSESAADSGRGKKERVKRYWKR